MFAWNIQFETNGFERRRLLHVVACRGNCSIPDFRWYSPRRTVKCEARTLPGPIDSAGRSGRVGLYGGGGTGIHVERHEAEKFNARSIRRQDADG